MYTFVNLSSYPSMAKYIISRIRLKITYLYEWIFRDSRFFFFFFIRNIHVSRHKFHALRRGKKFEKKKARIFLEESRDRSKDGSILDFMGFWVLKLIYFARLTFKFYFDEFLKIKFRSISKVCLEDCLPAI